MKEAESLEASVDQIYRHRFPAEMLERRRAVWRVICSSWLTRYIPPDSRVLEVAAGYCEFINNIGASRKVAVDLNPETKSHAHPEVEVHRIAAERVTDLLPETSFDRVFMSNFLEHCRDREHLLAVLRACHRVLEPGGCILILGPNFRYTSRVYFDFFDHRIALTDLSVAEALELAGFDVELRIPRTLPFSFHTRLPSGPWLVRLYLRSTWTWPLLGKQFLVIGRRR